MSRGNGRATVFHDASDYDAFVELLYRAKKRLPMRVLAWCLMPNHFHLVLLPHRDGDLGRWMHWLLTAHVQRHRWRHGTVGRIWQGRFKAAPIQHDEHLAVVFRYVERNPLRAGLVDRAERWRWSSLRARTSNTDPLLSPSPVSLPPDWLEFVHRPRTVAELQRVRVSIARGRPFGDPTWIQDTAERLGLMGTLRPRGRPRKTRGAAPGRGRVKAAPENRC
jgi:putative transposase